VWVNFPYFLQEQDEAAHNAGPDGPKESSVHPDLVAAGWTAMKQALATGHRLCIEGALHGLGHWQFAEPETVAAIVDTFLAGHPDLPPALRDYALQAREGHVQ
jgi:hypothetical protein